MMFTTAAFGNLAIELIKSLKKAKRTNDLEEMNIEWTILLKGFLILHGFGLDLSSSG